MRSLGGFDRDHMLGLIKHTLGKGAELNVDVVLDGWQMSWDLVFTRRHVLLATVTLGPETLRMRDEDSLRQAIYKYVKLYSDLISTPLSELPKIMFLEEYKPFPNTIKRVLGGLDRYDLIYPADELTLVDYE
jgi:hypothetical protein